MPGFNLNYYKNGNNPCHTKSFFTELKILTVQSLILSNILKFMHKYHHWRQYMPKTVAKMISSDAPLPGHSLENCNGWLHSHSTGKFRNVLSFKGPLFYLKYMPEIIETYYSDIENSHAGNSFKNKTKSFMLGIQSSGNKEEWVGRNFPLYCVPGLPRHHRENIAIVSYINQ